MQKTIAILLVAITVTITFGYIHGLTGSPYGAHNPDPDGTRWILDETRDPASEHHDRAAHVQHAPLAALDPQDEALLILAPETAYSEREIAALDAFLANGGRALIADTTGAGRHLVAQLDAGIEISSAPVYSTSYLTDPFRALVESTSEIPDLPVMLESPRAHAVTGTGTPVLETHPISWLDSDHNGDPDLGEPQGAFAVAMTVTLGQGELLVVAAPALFTDPQPPTRTQTIEQTRNAMLAWLTQDERTLVIHEAHRGNPDPLALTVALAHTAPVPQALLALFAAAFITLTVHGVRLRRVRPPRPRREETVMDPARQAALFELPPR